MRRSVTKVMFLLATLFWANGRALPQTVVPKSNIIHAEVVGLRSDKGQVICALYSSRERFPKQGERALMRVSSAIAQKQAVCEFAGIAPGTYAISVFHDENSSGKLDTKFTGIPREGVGASNNAKGHFGPPKFEAAAFSFSGGRQELKITINYL